MISPLTDHLLVAVIPGSPFDVGMDYKVELVHELPTGPAVCGRVLAVGPSPVIPDDAQVEDVQVEASDIVIFPPTSGFRIPAGRGSEVEYRMIKAAVVAGKVTVAQTEDAS